VPGALSLYGLTSYLKTQNAKADRSECAGILAFITSKKPEEAKEEGATGISKCIKF